MLKRLPSNDDEELTPVHIEFARGALAQKTVYDLAAAKGFYPEDWNVPTALAGVHSEVSEAYEAWRNGEGEKRIVEELSDAMARCMGIAEHLGEDIFNEMMHKFIENHKRPARHGKVNI